MRTILAKELIEEVGSPAFQLNEKFPYRACHDGQNYIYADVHEDAVDPIIVSNLFSEETTNDEKAFTIAKLMTSNDRSRHIHISNDDCKTLFRHPAWRLWCFNYEDEEVSTLEQDWEELTIILNKLNPTLAAQWPEYNPNLTKEQVNYIIKSAISSM